jgi:hypothetical protein
MIVRPIRDDERIRHERDADSPGQHEMVCLCEIACQALPTATASSFKRAELPHESVLVTLSYSCSCHRQMDEARRLLGMCECFCWRVSVLVCVRTYASPCFRWMRPEDSIDIAGLSCDCIGLMMLKEKAVMLLALMSPATNTTSCL